MSEKKDLGAEFPHGDFLQALLPIPFFAVWALDSFFFQLSTFPAVFIPIALRLVLAVVTLGFAFLLVELSHKLIFGDVRVSSQILDKGVYARVRHPMYLGTLLIYAGFILATLSILSFAVWIGMLLLYDRMATYEEKDLARIFGDACLSYQKRVPKWLPRITSPKE